ncbi:DUF3500 domain-containing protein [Candidatus Poribacteria bacterium]|nr:DUF3500 domain-containing protein [Candidatus Poribacteria bacterium]MYG09185.1 DUF3500 domain-containing protein [Candidatus Poribacteria bacterium]MYK21308.1 DUF3500 domain-containing protein [Candidatus Poribacteria bacterium]
MITKTWKDLMFRKILLTLIVMTAACIIALTIIILDAQTVETEKTEGIAEISTKPSIVALATVMKNFRASLSSELLADASFPLGHKASYSWTNLPPGRDEDRGGIRFGELSITQLARFYEVLSVFLSDNGYTKVSLITKDTEKHLSDISSSFWASNPYHIALFGNPETDGSWGFQLDGHHLALNFLVHGDAVSIVPALIGTAPAIIDGTGVLEDERGKAFALLNSLDENQKKIAIQKGRRGLQVGAGRSTDPFLNHDYSEFVGIGLKASEMNDTQKEHLRNLIKTYVYNLDAEFANIWMTDIDAGLDDTYFVWIGGTTPNDPIYYRIFNPAVWIEFNNEGRGLDHIHTIIRSPDGKDYGIFALNHGPKTLFEHYASADHHKRIYGFFDYRIESPQGTSHKETP